jgi:hypothetical protein
MVQYDDFRDRCSKHFENHEWTQILELLDNLSAECSRNEIKQSIKDQVSIFKYDLNRINSSDKEGTKSSEEIETEKKRLWLKIRKSLDSWNNCFPLPDLTQSDKAFQGQPRTMISAPHPSAIEEPESSKNIPKTRNMYRTKDMLLKINMPPLFIKIISDPNKYWFAINSSLKKSHVLIACAADNNELAKAQPLEAVSAGFHFFAVIYPTYTPKNGGMVSIDRIKTTFTLCKLLSWLPNPQPDKTHEFNINHNPPTNVFHSMVQIDKSGANQRSCIYIIPENHNEVELQVALL